MEDSLQGLEPRASRPPDGPGLFLLSCGICGEGIVVYHGVCMRRIFMKTISEGLVAVITFDNVTNRHSFDVREDEEEFRFWSCVSCRKPIYDEVRGYHKGIEDSMDEKLEQWLERRDLCNRLETESWPLILRSL